MTGDKMIGAPDELKSGEDLTARVAPGLPSEVVGRAPGLRGRNGYRTENDECRPEGVLKFTVECANGRICLRHWSMDADGTPVKKGVTQVYSVAAARRTADSLIRKAKKTEIEFGGTPSPVR